MESHDRVDGLTLFSLHTTAAAVNQASNKILIEFSWTHFPYSSHNKWPSKRRHWQDTRYRTRANAISARLHTVNPVKKLVTIMPLRLWLLRRCCCAFANVIWIVVSVLGGYPVKKLVTVMPMCPWWLPGCCYAVDMVLSECLLVARWLLTCYGCFPGCCYCCCYYVALWLLGCSKWFGLV